VLKTVYTDRQTTQNVGQTVKDSGWQQKMFDNNKSRQL